MSVEYFLSDHLGSTSITTDNTGAKVSEMRYTPWSEVRFSWTSATVTMPSYTLSAYTFTGQYSYMDDPSTSGVIEGFGLMFYNARWYDPSLGRFAQADTMIPSQQGVQAWDRYAYTNNNPVNYTDPTGHEICNEDGDCLNSNTKKMEKDKIHTEDYEHDGNNNRKNKTAKECYSVSCRAFNGDISSILNLLIPTHIGWRWQFEFSLNIPGTPVGGGGIIGLNFALNRVSDEMAFFADAGGEFGGGVGSPLGVSMTTGPLVGWGSSKISDIARGSAVNAGGTAAVDVAISINGSAPLNSLNPLDGLHVDPTYGQVPATIYAGGGGGYTYAGAGIGESTVFASAIITPSSASACFITC